MKRQSEQNLQTNIAENQAKVSEFDFVSFQSKLLIVNNKSSNR